MRYVLGLDVGTSVTKAAVFDREGREIGTVARRTKVLSPQPGWYEIAPDELFAAVAAACRDVVEQTGVTADRIEGLAISGVMVGGWLIDGEQRAVRPGILWNDSRSQQLVDSCIARHPDLMSQLFQSSGQLMQLGCTLPVLAWLAENEPEHVARSVAVLTAIDYLRMRLTGVVCTDETDAAVAPGDTRQRRFNPELLPLFGIGDLARLLPEVRASASSAGTLTEAAAAATGLRAGTPVAVGAGDQPACVLGAGAVVPGVACSVVGTTCHNGVVSDHPVFTPRDAGILFAVPGELWIKTTVNVAGTTNLDWGLSALCPDLVGRPDAYEELARLAAKSPAGASGAIYVPYLSHSGIVAPRPEAGARAGFVGLNPSHERGDLLRSIFEGLAYAIRDSYERIEQPVSAIRLVGGAARSPFWSQLIADVTGIAVEVPEGTEFGAKGAALLAATAIGWFDDIRAASLATFRMRQRFDPDPALREAYDRSYERYQVACDAVLDRVAPSYRGASL